MSQETLQYHWGKHYAGYVNNLNKLIEGTEFENYQNLEDIMLRSENAVYNNAAQAWNHQFFFEQFAQDPKLSPTGKLAEMIDREFGSYEKFVAKFTETATGLFGSGWVWLVADENQTLSIETTQNAINPATYQGLRPIMTLDVWEHAYYIDQRNNRAEYIKNFFLILDWNIIEKRY